MKFCCLDEGQLSQLLVFVTGADSIHPLGFDPQPHAVFGHAADLGEDDPTKQFPKANTCSNTIRLPVVATYEMFKDNMLSAIKMCNFFSDA